MRIELTAAALALAALTACGPNQVRVPDTDPPMTAPPEDAMRAPPTAD